MAEENRKVDSRQKGTDTSNQYPLDSKCYKIRDKIGKGVGAIVYKASCNLMDSSDVVAIKVIDLKKTKEDFDKEVAKSTSMTTTLLCHPNILKSHCSFTVVESGDLWVVMPFMEGGSLQSIMSSSSFPPDGLSEPCIATVLKEILSALSYLHGKGHCHRDIKAGNILIHSDGSVKLADFRVSASIYERRNTGSNPSGSSSYWMAPEVLIPSQQHRGNYCKKADIWSFGIIALELAHGRRPPLSHLRFSDHYEKTKEDSKDKKFSKSLKEMVGLCLNQDPSLRPTADTLLDNSFFKNCKGPEFVVKNVLQGLPTVEQRFSEYQRLHESGDQEEDNCSSGEIVKEERRITGWRFNEEGFELDPVFPSEETQKEGNYDDHRGSKQISFAGQGTAAEMNFDGDNLMIEELRMKLKNEEKKNCALQSQLDLKIELEKKSCALERELESLKLKFMSREQDEFTPSSSSNQDININIPSSGIHDHSAPPPDPAYLRLEERLRASRQGSKSITDYYTRFREIWEEYISDCSGITLVSAQESDSVLRFIEGLNESYDRIRMRVSEASPLPCLSDVYMLLLREEIRQQQRFLYRPGGLRTVVSDHITSSNPNIANKVNIGNIEILSADEAYARTNAYLSYIQASSESLCTPQTEDFICRNFKPTVKVVIVILCIVGFGCAYKFR